MGIGSGLSARQGVVGIVEVEGLVLRALGVRISGFKALGVRVSGFRALGV